MKCLGSTVAVQLTCTALFFYKKKGTGCREEKRTQAISRSWVRVPPEAYNKVKQIKGIQVTDSTRTCKYEHIG